MISLSDQMVLLTLGGMSCGKNARMPELSNMRALIFLSFFSALVAVSEAIRIRSSRLWMSRQIGYATATMVDL